MQDLRQNIRWQQTRGSVNESEYMMSTDFITPNETNYKIKR